MREIKKSPFSSIEKTNPLFVEELDTFGASKVNGYKITVRLSTMLIDTLRNIITSNKTGGNFEYTNVSDLLRKSLEAYKNGMSLIAQRTKDEKKETSFRVSRIKRILSKSSRKCKIRNNRKSGLYIYKT